MLVRQVGIPAAETHHQHRSATLVFVDSDATPLSQVGIYGTPLVLRKPPLEFSRTDLLACHHRLLVLVFAVFLTLDGSADFPFGS
jgi:hypothetical protein